MSSPVSRRRCALVGGTALAVLAPMAFFGVQIASADPPEHSGAGGNPPAHAPVKGHRGDKPVDDGVDPTTYVGGPEVVTEGETGEDVLDGLVFDDTNQNSVRDKGEKGISGVTVSNGREVVQTDAEGRYELPAQDKDTIFVTKPAGWDTPVDENNIAQFSYTHAPKGTTEQELRFGGLEPTGELPAAVNFPLAKNPSSAGEDIRCLVLADPQTYSNQEISHARNGALREAAAYDAADCGALLLGDIAGDDLGMYDRGKEALGLMGMPVRAIPGNHDLDFDATDARWSLDTYRQHWGPENYSYDVGEVHVLALNNVKYPCTPEDDNADGKRPACEDPAGAPAYNGRLGEDTLAWIEKDLATVPKDKRVVVATHIPLVSHSGADSAQHQTDDVRTLYELLEGREALSLSGHSHWVESMAEGDSLGAWEEAVGVTAVPFDHIVAGAVSGDWYAGDYDVDGQPMSFQGDGALPGFWTFDFSGTDYQHAFHATGRDGDQMGLGLNSPHYRHWAQTLIDWRDEHPVTWENKHKDAVPPLTLGDLGDQNMITREDLDGGTYLTANVWAGTTDSTVTVSIDGAEPVTAEITQPAAGEEVRRGVEWSDPSALIRQLTSARMSYQSTSGNPQAQGLHLYNGQVYGPSAPRPVEGNLADGSPHLWRIPLSADLENGMHLAEVVWTDRYGNEHTETLAFEVVDERPQQSFRLDTFGEDVVW